MLSLPPRDKEKENDDGKGKNRFMTETTIVNRRAKKLTMVNRRTMNMADKSKPPKVEEEETAGVSCDMQ